MVPSLNYAGGDVQRDITETPCRKAAEHVVECCHGSHSVSGRPTAGASRRSMFSASNHLLQAADTAAPLKWKGVIRDERKPPAPGSRSCRGCGVEGYEVRAQGPLPRAEQTTARAVPQHQTGGYIFAVIRCGHGCPRKGCFALSPIENAPKLLLTRSRAVMLLTKR